MTTTTISDLELKIKQLEERVRALEEKKRPPPVIDDWRPIFTNEIKFGQSPLKKMNIFSPPQSLIDK